MKVDVAPLARVLDGKETARAIRAEVAARVAALARRGVRPGLTVVLVGNDPASEVYVRNKDRAASEAGFQVDTRTLPATTTQTRLLELVGELNRDSKVHGVLVQLPLPSGLDARALLERLDPAKDVDGLTAANVAALWRGPEKSGEPEGLYPCTPVGCLELLERHGVELAGKRAVVIGRSQLVGKPLAALFLRRDATVTVCHSRTKDLPAVCREAEILVAAVGRPELVRRDWVRPGAVVLDVGINRGAGGKLCGDVAFDEVRAVAGAITPVPGGIGPMTIALLLQNTLRAAARSAGIGWDELARSG
jgi:methylenetetrahydrofolate dehydrogenase (NADP+)/methenyltetrahydrofolate cyclohydrolase